MSNPSGPVGTPAAAQPGSSSGGSPLALLADPAQPTPPSAAPAGKPPPASQRTGLWITLTPTTMTSSPFFDTLLVLVVSPLVTLTVVYALLLVRSRIRRRRWRAPKSLVERLPVRTYQSTASAPPPPPPPPPQQQQQQQPSAGASGPFPPPLRPPSLPHAAPDPLSSPAATAAAAPLSPTQAQAHAHVDRAFHRRWSGCSECVVCLEEYVDGVSRVMKLPCGHEFHVGCMSVLSALLTYSCSVKC